MELEYREKNLQTNAEKTQIHHAPSVMIIAPMTPHLITAITDSAEEFEQSQLPNNLSEYKAIVMQKMI